MKSTKTNTKAAKKKANASQHKRRSRSKGKVPSVIEVTTRDNIENVKPLTNEEKEDKGTKPIEPKFIVGTRMAKYFYDGEQESLRVVLLGDLSAQLSLQTDVLTEVILPLFIFQGRDRPYGGKVTAFDSKKKLYSILFDDGDVEEMSEEELGKLVVTPTQQELSYTEQEYLTASINNMHEDLLPGMLDILREVDKAPHKDASSLHLELDELDTKTQRALQRYVALNTKPCRVSYDAAEQDTVSRIEFNDLLVLVQSVQNDIAEVTRMLQSGE